MKKIILRSITFCSILSLFLTFNSCKEKTIIDDIPPIQIQKKVEFDNHSIEVTGNAQVSIIDNEVVIEKLGEPSEKFTFYVRPLTDTYWINILFNNLVINENVKLVESNFIKNTDTGERTLAAKTNYDSEKMQMENNMIGKSGNLLVANNNGGWDNPYEDIEVDSIQTIWPIVWGVAAAVGYVLDKISYCEKTVEDADGNTITTITKDWGGSCGTVAPSGEVYGDLDKHNAFELSRHEIIENVVPVVIDGTEVTCTGLPFVRIKGILTSRAPF